MTMIWFHVQNLMREVSEPKDRDWQSQSFSWWYSADPKRKQTGHYIYVQWAHDPIFFAVWHDNYACYGIITFDHPKQCQTKYVVTFFKENMWLATLPERGSGRGQDMMSDDRNNVQAVWQRSPWSNRHHTQNLGFESAHLPLYKKGHPRNDPPRDVDEKRPQRRNDVTHVTGCKWPWETQEQTWRVSKSSRQCVTPWSGHPQHSEW